MTTPLRIRVEGTFLVEDRNALLKLARVRYAQRWLDPDWRPVNLGEALLEATINCSVSPCDNDSGVILDDSKYKILEGDAVIPNNRKRNRSSR